MNNLASQSVVCDIQTVEDRLDPKFYCLRKSIKNKIEKLQYGKKEFIGKIGIVKDGDHGKRLYVDEGIPYLRITNIEEGKIVLNSEKVVYILKETHEKLKRAHIKPHDILIPIMGTIEGNIVTVPNDFPECNSNRAIARITIRDEYKKRIIPEYIEAYLSTQFGQMQIARISRGSIQVRVNFNDINSIILPLPDKDTIQKHVASLWIRAKQERDKKLDKARDILKYIDNFILDKLKIELPEKKENIYLYDFKDIHERLDPLNYNPWFEDLIKTMKKHQKDGNYEVKLIGNVVEFSDNIFDKNDKPTEYFKYVEIENVNPDTGEVTFQWKLGSEPPSRAQRSLKTNDVVISTNDPIRGSIGIVPSSLNNAVGTSGFLVVRPKKNEIKLNYLYTILRFNATLRQMNRWKTGSTQVAITKPNFSKIFIPVPNDEKLQNYIGDNVIEMTNKIKVLRQEADEVMETAKKEILQVLKLNGNDK